MIGVIRRRLGHDAFDQNELSACREGLAAVRQNAGAALVDPIVDRAFQDECIRAARNGFEEIAGDEFRAITDSRIVEMLFCTRGARGLIEHRAAQRRIGEKNRREQFAGSAADIDEAG
jgi:hypothetical protein